MFAWILVATVTAATAVAPTTAAVTAPHARAFRAADPDDADLPARWSFSVGARKFRMDADGPLAVAGKPGRETPSLVLPGTEEDQIVERLYYLAQGDDVVLVYGVGNNLSGSGRACRLALPSLKLRWAIEIPSYNIGPPVAEGADAYVTAMGFAGRLDLTSGRWRWNHDDLFESKSISFEEFAAPRMAGSVVVFRAAHPPYPELRLDKRDGRILLRND